MAIWQYQLFVIPGEEINSYFGDNLFIDNNALNEINWWKYRQLTINNFNIFKSFLPLKQSWSSDIILFGDESSNCIELLMDNNIIVEISIRIDVRNNYKEFVLALCDFSQKYGCVLLNDTLKILSPIAELIEQDIIIHPLYKSFLDKLNK
ncbi:hypothetical protein [Larkinella sp.]|uniref:hypothetical protein n=1 Tax=Larkinella sp. TaxID=2034517 RepID=UPI003BAA7ADE